MKHSEIRDRITATASALFYANGYNSTGINEIIAETGIAKATLYSHFKSKEDICIAYLQHMNTTFLKDIKVFCEKRPSGKEQLLGLFDFLNTFFKEKDFNGCWCIKTVAEIPQENTRVREEIKTQKTDFIQFIVMLIKNNLSELADIEVTSLARRIYLLYESAVSESHLHQEDWPIEDAKIICADMIG